MTKTAKVKRKGGLGRGLDALFQDGEAKHYDNFIASLEPTENNSSKLIQELDIAKLVPGKYQPRSLFSDEKLQQLVKSIKSHGVLQPLLVRYLKNGEYEIIAGERRWRAAQQAKLHKVPVIVKDIDDATALEIALIENLQRQDLNPLEEAEGYKRLIEEFSYKQEDLANKLGKSRSHIANIMRLLKLPLIVQKMLEDEMISMGHARALIGVENAEQIAKHIVKQSLSVRDTEKYIRNLQKDGVKSQKLQKNKKMAKSVDVLALEKEISLMLGMKVTINSKSSNAKQGSISIEYRNLDQLDSILEKLSL